MNSDAVDAILMCAVRWAKDCASPIGHHQVVAILKTVGTCLCAQQSASRPAVVLEATAYLLRDLSRPSRALQAI